MGLAIEYGLLVDTGRQVIEHLALPHKEHLLEAYAATWKRLFPSVQMKRRGHKVRCNRPYNWVPPC